MSAAIYNFTLEQGTTTVKVITYADADGNPINITGYSARMQMRPSVGSQIKYLDLTSSPAVGIAINGPLGQITITISAATSATVPTDGVYDLELVDGASAVIRLLQGTITVSPEVTR
jgi:hypothetical protein